MKDSITLGVVSGAATGAASASMFSHTDKGEKALSGAAVGALVGGIASYFIHGSLEKRDANVRRKTLFNLENFGVTERNSNSEGSPYLSKPQVEEVWVNPKVKGSSYIEGHKEWRIINKPTWSTPSRQQP